LARIRRFLRLRAADQWLLLRIVFLSAAIRLALRLLPFRTVQRVVRKTTVRSRQIREPDALYRDRIIWAVDAAGRHVLGDKSCLTQALTGQFLFTRGGYPSHFRIGVAKAADGKLEAHAWLESQGRVVIGGPAAELSRYTPLPDWDEATA
jgi:hypothetical protein